MPLYGFECQDCEDEFEELVMSSSTVDDVVCPKCGSKHVQRQLSLVAAIKTTGNTGYNAGSATCAPSG